MPNKKRFTAEEKTKIIREFLENGTPISELSEKYGINPNVIYNWKKQLFENAPDIFSGKHKKRKSTTTKEEKRIKELEETLRIRESLISDIVADNIMMRKKNDGPA